MQALGRNLPKYRGLAILFTGLAFIGNQAHANPAEACLTEICGSSGSFVNAIDAYRSNLQIAKSAIQFNDGMSVKAEDAMAMQEYFNQRKMSNDLYDRPFKDGVKMNGAELTGLARGVYNLEALIHFAVMKPDPSRPGFRKLDAAATRKKNPSLTDAQLQQLQQSADFLATVEAKIPAGYKNVQQFAIETSLQNLHPNMSYQDSLNQEISAAVSTMNETLKKGPLARSVVFNDKSPERILYLQQQAQSGKITENEIREILSFNASWQRMRVILFDANSPLLKHSTPKPSDLLGKIGGNQGMLQIQQQDHLKQLQRLREDIEDCKVNYALNQAVLPTAAQKEVLRKDIEQSKLMVIQMIKKKFPPEMQASAIAKIQATEFNLPPSKDEFDKAFTSSLIAKANSLGRANQEVAKANQQDLAQLLTAFRSFGPTENSSSSENSNELCSEFVFDPFVDANYSNYGSIILSYTTAQSDPRNRLSTIMHELGHSLARSIKDDPKSSSKLASLTNCFASMHTSNDGAFSDKYFGEDFADAVAESSMPQMKERNPWCYYLNRDATGLQFADQDIENKQTDKDEHSSFLFRLLHTQSLSKGSLPSSCEKYLSTRQDAPRIAPCLNVLQVNSKLRGTQDGAN